MSQAKDNSLPIRVAALSARSLRLACFEMAKRDAMLGGIVDQHGYPPLWDRKPGFATLAHIILEQQVSLSSAAAINERIRKKCDGRVSAKRILELGESGLRDLGVTRQKSHYIHLLAEGVSSRKFRISSLPNLAPEEARELLQSQKGIGVWTTEVYLLMALCYRDAFPVGDLALIRELGHLLGRDMNWDEVLAYATRWAPNRAVASRILWHSYLARKAQ